MSHPVPFLILGLPRSGTNLLSATLRAHSLIELAIEPYSMHVDGVLRDELLPSTDHAAGFDCSCHSCFTCELRSWMRVPGTVRGFKETALFEYLPQIESWVPELRFIVLQRNREDIIASIDGDHLFSQWNMASRFFAKQMLKDIERPSKAQCMNIVNAYLDRKITYYNDFKKN